MLKRLGFFCAILAPVTIAAQSGSFDRAAAYFKNHDWEHAQSDLDIYLAQDIKSPDYAAALLLASKVSLKRHLPKASITYSSRFMREFPQNPYEGHARLLYAEALYMMEKEEAAIRELAVLTQRPSDLAATAESTIKQIARTNLSQQRIAAVLPLIAESELKDAIIIERAQKLADQQRFRLASELLEEVSRHRPKNAVIKKASSILKSIKGKSDGPVRIGLITSLSGANAETGKAIKSGIDLAIKEWNARQDQDIELITYDDQSDVLQCINAARALCSNDAIGLVIGPIESSAMAAAAVICDENKIPILSATASKTGLAGIGEFVYQANVDIESRARAIARYAVEILGKKHFAVLLPADPYGDAAAAPFAEEIEKLGGTLIAFEKYYDNTSDFKSQLTRIRKAGFIDQATGSFPNTVSARLSQRSIDSLYVHYYPEDTLGLETSSDFNVPLEHIEGLFLPVYVDEIRYIAPQLAFYNIKTQLLGMDNWNDVGELRLQQNYVNGVIFASESYVDSKNQRIQNFRSSFQKTYGKVPSGEAYYGYDIMGLITSLVDNNITTSEGFQTELSRGVSYTGLHNKITMPKGGRVNTSTHLLQFKDGQIQKLTP